jgi:predicted  nucleic acid-binding Zn-ribbon protein
MPHQCTDCGRRFDDGSKEMLSGCPDCGGNKFQFHPDGVDSSGPEESPEPPDPPEPSVNNSVARTVGNAATAVRDLVGGSSSGPDADEESAMAGGPDFDSTTPAEAQATSPVEGLQGSTTRQNSSTETESAVGQKPSASASQRQSTSGTNQTQSSVDREPITGSTVEQENSAQASARSDVVSPDDLPPAPDTPTRTRPAPVMDEDSETGPTDDKPVRTDRPDLNELREELNEQFESIRVLEPGQYELNLMELFDREEYIIALQEDGKYTIQVPERWEE